MKNCCTYDISGLGFVSISEEDGYITRLDFGKTEGGASSPLTEEAARQLGEYMQKKRKEFDLPLKPHGTAFQKKVWEALQKIPYGQTCSYKDIATKIGHPLACRAVGNANNKNPVAVFIPCHRVVGAGGKLTGYAGGLEKKQILLDVEKN